MKLSHKIITGLAIGFALVIGLQIGMAVTDHFLLVFIITLGCGLIARLMLHWFFKKHRN
jgi:ribose/xylose/arabinose/galactoside ABC-type transport system permease subunit